MAVAACSHWDAVAVRLPFRWCASAVFIVVLMHATVTMWLESPALAVVNAVTASAFALTAQLLSARVSQQAMPGCSR